MPGIHAPRTTADVVRLLARHPKNAVLLPGAEFAPDKTPGGKVLIDISNIEELNRIEIVRNRVAVGTGVNLGRLLLEVQGDNRLLRVAASMMANPLVRNRVTLAEALDPDSLYFDITTPMVVLDAKVRLQNPKGRRTLSILGFLQEVTEGLRKGELPTLVEFSQLPPKDRVSFFRLSRDRKKGAVSAAARLNLKANRCKEAEIVVSGSTLIPLRTPTAERELIGAEVTESAIRRAASAAAAEVIDLAQSKDTYERNLIEIVVGRTLRQITEATS